MRVEGLQDGGQAEPAPTADADLSSVFSETPDPAAYVSRAASDRVLGAMVGTPEARAECVYVCGPPGLGKSLLLRIHALRLQATGTKAPYVPCATLPLADLCRFAAALARAPSADDPIAALRGLAGPAWSRRGALHLVIDDANAMPIETARALGDLVRGLAGRLHLTLAGLDDARTSRVLAGLGLDAVEVRFRDPMTLEETRRYVMQRLDDARVAGTVRAHFGADVIERLHGLSGGIPRRVNLLAGELIRGEAGRVILRRLAPDWNDGLLEAASSEPGARTSRSGVL